MPEHPAATIVFTHVPKTAGTSFVADLVEANLSAEEIGSTASLRSLRRRYRPCQRFLTGHSAYGAHLLIDSPVVYTTFLREPIDRAVSYYHFVRDPNPGTYRHPDRDRAERLSLVEFTRRRADRNTQARYLAGVLADRSYLCAPVAVADRLVRTRAIAHLRRSYRCIGLQNRYEESIGLFQKAFGWTARNPQAVRLKKTGLRPALVDLSPAVLAELASILKVDLEVYDVGRQLFEGMLARPPDLRSCLALRSSTHADG